VLNPFIEARIPGFRKIRLDLSQENIGISKEKGHDERICASMNLPPQQVGGGIQGSKERGTFQGIYPDKLKKT
jgi:hypothetical protein